MTPSIGIGEDESHEGTSTFERSTSIASIPGSWTVMPMSGYLNGYIEDEDPTNLCSQCSKIDFKAIFNLNPKHLGRYGDRTCSFSALSRSMLTSGCSACRVFATSVYHDFTHSHEATMSLEKGTFEGHLIALSSGGLSSSDLEPAFMHDQSIVLRMEICIPLPATERPPHLLPGSHISGLIYVRARSIILPAATKEATMIDLKTLRDDDVFCYGMPAAELVDFSLFSTMFYRCRHSHRQCRASGAFTFPQMARVVDCETRQIVPMAYGLSYIALSYVWGSSMNTNRSNWSEKSRPLELLPADLPKLIEDAIDVTVRLGYQILWVDFFCIDQSHTTDKAFQIQQMASIYNHASATICALVAQPHLGLPGISRSRPVSESFLDRDTNYIRIPGPEALLFDLKDSVWSSRGWTFQEALLSRRCLFFTEEQVTMVCREAQQSKTTSQLTDGLRWGSDTKISRTILGGSMLAPSMFHWLINQYQRRNLSYESDALNACKGLLSLAPTRSYYGILLPRSYSENFFPSVAFARGLLWMTLDPKNQPQELRANFPSWSWVSRRNVSIYSDLISNETPPTDLHHENVLHRALDLWISCPEKTWAAGIFVNTHASGLMNFETFFHKSPNTKVIPEESRMLWLRSVLIKYKISKVDLAWKENERDSARVEVERSDHLPLELPDPDRATMFRKKNNRSLVRFFYDDMASLRRPKERTGLAILLVAKSSNERDEPCSYWMAIRPAYSDDGDNYIIVRASS